ncbi:amidase [Variovorax arabinosiphilus]|uniref:amidase n=1 Tax=Variovorax arabinosiphilus TaxID=3053498 RepID=UPI002578B836|nr:MULTISPECIES: amidase [unclassified Variovorax]MDM0119050.1 amidase [Variovorax sp. J2L1-78]MDM0129476.1 amidase [Variovorax sp. J2L1-63]MDM0232738.1 amidase [Variovorax sp. J2R1-6]
MTTHALQPTLLDSLTFASARAQAEALAAGRVTAVELLEHVLARIDRFDRAINAVVVRNDEAARAAAREADAALARGERRPLLGVPITVKESFDVAGFVTSSGNPDYADNVAAQDALAVAALRKAGAVIVGKSNVPLALADLQSYNAIYGVSNNPWDTTRTPGGSSGGSTAALAAGYVALELGTDIGGSIRIPAHFTGVYGHKPTAGLVALGGTGVPSGRRADRDLTVAGPLARTAADLELALDLLLNLEPLAAKAWKASLPPARHTQLKDFRVLVIDQWPGNPRSLHEALVVERVVERLRTQGVQVSRTADVPVGLLPDLVLQHRVYRSLLGSSLAAPPALSEAAQKRLEALAPDDDSADAALLRAPTLRHSEWLKDNERRVALRHQWERFFDAFDVVVTPVAPLPAFAHNHSEPKDARTYPVAFEDGTREVRFLDLFHWAGLPVLPGLPATSFPVGLDAEGLPVSAQAVGPYLEDRTTIAFAGLLEALYGGFVAPPGYDTDPAYEASRP